MAKKTRNTGTPRPPSGLVAKTASSKEINVTWNAAADDEGVVAYYLERKEISSRSLPFVQIATVSTTAYADAKGLFSETGYEYKVRAIDVTGKLGDYSDSTKAQTFGRRPAYREWWDKVQALINRDPNNIDIDTLCQLKAMEAVQSLAMSGSLSPQFGKGWNIDCSLPIQGYVAAKAALPRHTAEKGPLGGFLFETAKAAILDEIRSQCSPTGKATHQSKAERAASRKKYPWRYSGNASLDSWRQDEADGLRAPIEHRLSKPAAHGGLYVEYSDDDQDPRITAVPPREDDEVTVLAPETLAAMTQQELDIIARYSRGATLIQIAKLLGISKSTVSRRIKKLPQKLLTTAQK